MTSNKKASSSSTNHLTMTMPPVHDGTNDLNQVITGHPMIAMISSPVPTPPSSRVSRKRHISIHSFQVPKRSNHKLKQPIELTMSVIGFRIRMQNILNGRLAFVSDAMSLLSLVGIVLMITENELSFKRINDGDTPASGYIKIIISITTAILLGLICYYHHLDLKLYSIQNGVEDTRVALTKTRVLLILLELVICAIHPIPRSSLRSYSEDGDAGSSDFHPLSFTPIDVGLGLPMFLRLYLFGRSIMFHSYLFRDASLRSINYLNQVSIDFVFLIKTSLEQWPTRCLLAFCIIIGTIGSWALRACSYNSTKHHLSFLDAAWLFIVTFTTVGYGDIYPSTYCGRAVVTIISVIGLLAAALLIAVLTQKLLLTREEKYVHTFVLNMELAKQREHQAANVVKFAMKTWYLKRQNKFSLFQTIQAQQKLFRSLDRLHAIKKQQSRLVDNCIGLHELMNAQRSTSTQQDETVQQVAEMKNDIKNIEGQLNDIIRTMNSLQTTLNMLVRAPSSE